MNQVINKYQTAWSRIVTILTLSIYLPIISACGEMNVFVAVQKNSTKITNVELDNDGHFAISLTRDARLGAGEIEFYVQKQATLPNTTLNLGSSLDGVSGMAFQSTQIESALAPSKTLEAPSGKTNENSWTYPETIDSNLYYLIELKSSKKSVKAAMTYMVIARAALAAVQGIEVKRDDKGASFSWTASPYATSYVIYRDDTRKQIFASTEALEFSIDSSTQAIPEKLWIEARRGSLASRVLSPIALNVQGSSDDAILSETENSVIVEMPAKEQAQVLLNSVTGVKFFKTYSSTTTVNFSWNASTDPRVVSYGVKICSSANCTTSCSSVVTKTGLSHSLEGVDGASYFACVRGEDGLGNYSNFVHSNNPITIDTIAPTASSVSIAAGAEYISTLATTITLSSIAADDMYVTESPSCASGGVWENYSNSKPWTFTKANMSNSIYVKYRDHAGNESPCVSDTIIHDNQAPSATNISINNGDSTTSSTSVTLSLNASDGSPVEMYVTNDAGCSSGGNWESFTPTKAWTLGQMESTATVYVVFRDAALNMSTCLSASILHQAPEME